MVSKMLELHWSEIGKKLMKACQPVVDDTMKKNVENNSKNGKKGKLWQKRDWSIEGKEVRVTTKEILKG